MTARIIDGRAVASKVRARCALRVRELAAFGVTPGLAVIMVGDDPASMVYVRNKANACGEIGIYSEMHVFPKDCDQSEGRFVGDVDFEGVRKNTIQAAERQAARLGVTGSLAA